MHPGAAFHATAERALELARRHPFAVLSLAAGGGVTALQTPLIPVLDGTGAVIAFEGHAARANRAMAALQTSGGAAAGLAVFSGPDAYIPPSAYASRPGGRVAPTWNYLSVEAEGVVALIEDREQTLAILERQAGAFEGGEDDPWSLDEASPDYLDRLTVAIAGLRLDVERFEATAKLGQTTGRADFESVIQALSRRSDENSRAIAAEMTELRKG